MVDIIHKLKKLTGKTEKSFEITEKRKKTEKFIQKIQEYQNFRTVIGGRFIAKSKKYKS
jgi:hypothetical protein